MKAFVVSLLAAVGLLILVGPVGTAQAQQAPGVVPGPGQPTRVQVIPAGGGEGPARVQVRPAGGAAAAAPAAPSAAPNDVVKSPKDRDKTESSGPGMAALFWLVALGTIGGSIFVITRRNLIAAVMGMVGTFFAVATLYMMLYANFLAVIQMLVYAGAIMVLFVFVVMILNKPEDEPYGRVGIPGKVLAALGMLYLTFRLGSTLWAVKPPEAALAAPKPVMIVSGPGSKAMEPAAWGSTAAVGTNLFDEYLFPFEAVSILLLVAVVGAIAVARPLKDDEPETLGEAAQS